MPNDNEVKQEDKNISEKSIAMELLMEIRLQTKRWMIAFFTVVILWFATIVGFVWYLNQYDFTSTVEQTGLYTFSDSNGNVISSDITDEQMKEILEIINGEN